MKRIIIAAVLLVTFAAGVTIASPWKPAANRRRIRQQNPATDANPGYPPIGGLAI